MNDVIVNASELRTALKVASLFADRDQTSHPAIQSVFVTAADGVLSAMATDRYAIGRYQMTAVGDWGGKSLLLSSMQVKLLRTTLRHVGDEVTIHLTASSIRITSPELTWRLPVERGASIVVDCWTASRDPGRTIESVAKLLDGKDMTPVERISFDIRLLARFAKVRKIVREFDQPIFELGGKKEPTRVRISDAVSALIMQVNIRAGA